MFRIVLYFALPLALTAFAVQWLEHVVVVQAWPASLFAGLVALGFLSIGLWGGRWLGPQTIRGSFTRNEACVRSLGLSPRECEILDILSSGQSIKEIARALSISPHTVKTHTVRLYGKLGVKRRVHAIEKARMLGLIR